MKQSQQIHKITEQQNFLEVYSKVQGLKKKSRKLPSCMRKINYILFHNKLEPNKKILKNFILNNVISIKNTHSLIDRK